MNWRFNDDKSRVVLDKPTRSPKKITAGRLGTVLGLNAWQTPFSAWCGMNRVYVDPFVENKYTIAGKAIEPILIEYAKKEFEGGVESPEEYYGTKNPAQANGYDFFKDTKIFGGMWDAIILSDVSNNVGSVIEIKTSSRPQDWEFGVPDEKLLQALLYGHFLKTKRTFVEVAFLEDKDYIHPERFVPTEKNTKFYSFETETATIMLDGEACTISELLEFATQWWTAFIKTGVSPEFDNKKDDTILKELRTQRPDEDENLTYKDIINNLNGRINELTFIKKENSIEEREKEISTLKDSLKRVMMEGMGDDDAKIQVDRWTLTKQNRNGVDTDLLKSNGIYNDYIKTSTSYVLKEIKEK